MNRAIRWTSLNSPFLPLTRYANALITSWAVVLMLKEGIPSTSMSLSMVKYPSAKASYM